MKIYRSDKLVEVGQEVVYEGETYKVTRVEGSTFSAAKVVDGKARKGRPAKFVVSLSTES